MKYVDTERQNKLMLMLCGPIAISHLGLCCSISVRVNNKKENLPASGRAMAIGKRNGFSIECGG